MRLYEKVHPCAKPMLSRSWRRMLFKIGVSVIILVAVYMYYAVNQHQEQTTVDADGEGLKYSDSNGDIGVVSGRRSADENVAVLTVDDNAPETGKTHTTTSNEDKHAVALEKEEAKRQAGWRESIHIAVVACGDRMDESLVMLKSAVMFTHTHLVFHIFTEPILQVQFKIKLDFWPPQFRERLEYRLYNITFPSSEDIQADDWKKLFKPCACQRLFIPELVPDVDSLLYVDTDMLFLTPLEEVWALFKEFNSSQLAAVAIEHEDRAIGWYNRFARHPYYGEVGVNSGVMLMNLTRLRQSSWIQSMSNYFKEYKLKLTFGDQDLINIYFHFFPEQLYIFSCELNYRPDHCMYMSVCKPAEQVGARVLHGSRRVWFEDKQPAFKAVYKTFNEHHLGDSLRYQLLVALNRNLKAATESNCGKVPNLFTKSIEIHLDNIEEKRELS